MTRALPRHKADPPATNAANPVELLQYAVANGVQPAQLKEMMDLANQWRAQQAAEQFGIAVSALQHECPIIFKGRQADRYSFAGFDDIWAAVRPIAGRNGLSIAFSQPKAEPGWYTIVVHLRVGLHQEDRPFSMPIGEMQPIIQAIADKQKINFAQAVGTWLQYQKRYAFCAALNIVTGNEDTDLQGMRDVLLLDEDQRKQIDDWINTGIIKPDGTLHKLTEAGLLKWLQGDLPEADRSLDRLTQDHFERIVSTFKAKLTHTGGSHAAS